MSTVQKYKPLPEDLAAIMGMPCVATMRLNFVPYKNSTVVPCSRCGERCFVGPVSYGLHVHSKLPIICANCLLQEYGPDAVLEMMRPLTDKQMGE